MSLPAGTYVPTKVTRPRKTGGPGADSPCQGEMARRARGGREGDFERPLREGAHRSHPRRRFAYFAAGGKVGRPAGRNRLYIEERPWQKP